MNDETFLFSGTGSGGIGLESGLFACLFVGFTSLFD
jgi:hypothetical protein